ncbi:MAG: Rrf2 family transcriptional regulator [Nitrospinae bacterium]|nr:Rrf2 family transcriptional regulator [Nitrospinota bacterium]
MKISTKGHYAVQAMVDLATQPANFPIPLSNISLRQNISLNYLEQLFLKLRKAKLVKSVRGPGGGYLLAKKPSEVSIGEIFEAVDENLILSDCVDNSSFCSKTTKCLTQILWAKVTDSFKKTLYSITLSEVCSEAVSQEEHSLRSEHGFIYHI